MKSSNVASLVMLRPDTLLRSCIVTLNVMGFVAALLMTGTPAALAQDAVSLSVELAGQNAIDNTEPIDPVKLIERIETQYQGSSSYSKITMSIQTRNWRRTLVMEAWSEGRDKFLTRILDPQKEKGTATLKVNDDIWNYLPRIDRLVKVPSSMMGDKWMGSHLTNDDLVKENKIDKLYDLSIESREGNKVIVTGLPKPDAAVVWGRIRYAVDLEKQIPLQIEYFDEENARVRTMTFSDAKQIDERWLPMKFVIQPEDAPGECTAMTYSELKFGIETDKGLFTIQQLRRQ